MDNGSGKRKNLKFTEINKLSQSLDVDYNELIYGESGFSRYAMNHILRNYAGLDENFRIHALFEHGIIYTDTTHGPYRVHENLPSIVASQYRVKILENQKNFKGAYAIGPYIHYANSLLTEQQLIEEKERLGKTLLVFPSHSIDGIVKKFDYTHFINKIKEISDDYDSVRICMYYKDVLLKNYIPYKNEGFEIVTAGHFNDYNFLPRLKSIIKCCDTAMANDIGSQLGYCLYLEKPYYLTSMDEVGVDKEDDSNQNKMMLYNEKISMDIINSNDNVLKIKKLFSEYNDKITKEQHDFIGYLWGFDHVKTPDELQNLFLKLDDEYSIVKYYFSQFKRLKDLLKLKYFDSRKM